MAPTTNKKEAQESQTSAEKSVTFNSRKKRCSSRAALSPCVVFFSSPSTHARSAATEINYLPYLTLFLSLSSRVHHLRRRLQCGGPLSVLVAPFWLAGAQSPREYYMIKRRRRSRAHTHTLFAPRAHAPRHVPLFLRVRA